VSHRARLPYKKRKKKETHTTIFKIDVKDLAKKKMNLENPSLEYVNITTLRVPGSAGTAGTDPSMDSSFWELFLLTPFRPFFFNIDLYDQVHFNWASRTIL
jgi:hypothetical protein